jgi:secreted PhoX family phosphatase
VVSTLAGTPGSFAFADGTGSAARFNGNGGLALDAAGNLFVADWDNFLVRRVTAAGVVTTLAGSPGSAGSTDGTGAAARFVNPNGLAIDTAGNVYVADWGNATIRRITPAGVVTTLAGTPGSPGSADGTGAAARFSLPTGVAVDSAGNVYVADQGNNTIRRITPAGVVTTLAGSAGSAGSTDGTGSAARFTSPSVLSISPTGDLFVIAGVNGETVRKITAAGVVTTVVGVAGQASAVVLGANPRLRNGRAVHAISSNRLLVTADNALLDITVP